MIHNFNLKVRRHFHSRKIMFQLAIKAPWRKSFPGELFLEKERQFNFKFIFLEKEGQFNFEFIVLEKEGQSNFKFIFLEKERQFNFGFIFDWRLKTCIHVLIEYLNFSKGCIIQLFRHEFECSTSEVCILCKTPLIESNVARVCVLQIISNNHNLYNLSQTIFFVQSPVNWVQCYTHAPSQNHLKWSHFFQMI